MPGRRNVSADSIWPEASALWARPARSVCRAVAHGPKPTGDVLAAAKSDGVEYPLGALCWTEKRGFVRYEAGVWVAKKCAHCGALARGSHTCEAPRWAALEVTP